MTHLDPDIQEAIVRLNDALCTWERNTGRQSVLILREVGGWFHRSQSGKPLPRSCDDVSDWELIDQVINHV